ncbi:leucine-rich_repeat domain-containing protein [Hexamita inflata]|uniref:Leucine-rich repeat domain-containing protein n=1 Tax=Hexamita inflata TaxID=28002 RepID=A0AA86NBA5_9EUKA|nr:leucine-rich repeat domain-containing protein [Hexamita inflata]
MTQLKRITLYYTQQLDISCFKYLTELSNISLYGNCVTDLQPLLNLEKLKEFCFQNMNLRLDKITEKNTKIILCQQISNLKYLQKLDISNSFLTDISSISKLVDLKELNISCNYQISDISSLKTLRKIVKLDIFYNIICDLHAISFMKDLKEICAYRNKIIDVNPLYFCSGLQILQITDNDVVDPTVLKNIDFKELEVSWNKIRDPSYFIKYNRQHNSNNAEQNQPSVEEVSHANILTHIHNSFMSLYKTQQLMRQKRVRKEIQNLKVQFTAVKTHLITQMNAAVQLLIQFIME